MLALGIGTGALCLLLPFTSAVGLAEIAGLGSLYSLWALPGQSEMVTAVGVQIMAVLLMVFTVQVSDSAYDYYRMWGGDLKRRGLSERAVEKYERANALKPHAPARRLQLGRLYERLGREDDAFEVYTDSFRIVGAYVDDAARKHILIRWITLYRSTWANCFVSHHDAISGFQRQRGLSTEADASRLCELNALSDAETAVERSMALNPRDQREAFKLRRQLRKVRK